MSSSISSSSSSFPLYIAVTHTLQLSDSNCSVDLLRSAYRRLFDSCRGPADSPAEIQQLIPHLPKLYKMLIRDLHSPDAGLSLSTLHALGYFLHHPTFVLYFPPEGIEAIKTAIPKCHEGREAALYLWIIAEQSIPSATLDPYIPGFLEGIRDLLVRHSSQAIQNEAIFALKRLTDRSQFRMTQFCHLWIEIVFPFLFDFSPELSKEINALVDSTMPTVTILHPELGKKLEILMEKHEGIKKLTNILSKHSDLSEENIPRLISGLLTLSQILPLLAPAINRQLRAPTGKPSELLVNRFLVLLTPFLGHSELQLRSVIWHRCWPALIQTISFAPELLQKQSVISLLVKPIPRTLKRDRTAGIRDQLLSNWMNLIRLTGSAISREPFFRSLIPETASIIVKDSEITIRYNAIAFLSEFLSENPLNDSKSITIFGQIRGSNPAAPPWFNRFLFTDLLTYYRDFLLNSSFGDREKTEIESFWKNYLLKIQNLFLTNSSISTLETMEFLMNLMNFYNEVIHGGLFISNGILLGKSFNSCVFLWIRRVFTRSLFRYLNGFHMILTSKSGSIPLILRVFNGFVESFVGSKEFRLPKEFYSFTTGTPIPPSLGTDYDSQSHSQRSPPSLSPFLQSNSSNQIPSLEEYLKTFDLALQQFILLFNSKEFSSFALPAIENSIQLAQSLYPLDSIHSGPTEEIPTIFLPFFPVFSAFSLACQTPSSPLSTDYSFQSLLLLFPLRFSLRPSIPPTKEFFFSFPVSDWITSYERLFHCFTKGIDSIPPSEPNSRSLPLSIVSSILNEILTSTPSSASSDSSSDSPLNSLHLRFLNWFLVRLSKIDEKSLQKQELIIASKFAALFLSAIADCLGVDSVSKSSSTTSTPSSAPNTSIRHLSRLGGLSLCIETVEQFKIFLRRIENLDHSNYITFLEHQLHAIQRISTLLDRLKTGSSQPSDLVSRLEKLVQSFIQTISQFSMKNRQFSLSPIVQEFLVCVLESKSMREFAFGHFQSSISPSLTEENRSQELKQVLKGAISSHGITSNPSVSASNIFPVQRKSPLNAPDQIRSPNPVSASKSSSTLDRPVLPVQFRSEPSNIEYAKLPASTRSAPLTEHQKESFKRDQTFTSYTALDNSQRTNSLSIPVASQLTLPDEADQTIEIPLKTNENTRKSENWEEKEEIHPMNAVNSINGGNEEIIKNSLEEIEGRKSGGNSQSSGTGEKNKNSTTRKSNSIKRKRDEGGNEEEELPDSVHSSPVKKQSRVAAELLDLLGSVVSSTDSLSSVTLSECLELQTVATQLISAVSTRLKSIANSNPQ